MNDTLQSSDARPGLAGFPPGVAACFLWVYVAEFLPVGVVTPYLQLFLKHAGFADKDIGLLQGAMGMMTMLAPPLWGYVSDRLGRPRLVIGVAVLATIPAFVLLWLAGSSLTAAIAAIMVYGFFREPILALTDGLTMRYIHLRGGDYGFVRSFGSAAFIAGVLAMMCLDVEKIADVRGLLMIAIVVGMGLHALSLLSLPPVHAAGTRVKYRPDLRVLLQRGFVLLTLAAVMGRISMTGYYYYFTLYLKESLHVEQTGWLWIIGPISEIPMIFFSGRLMKRFGVRGLFGLSLVGTAVRLWGFGSATAAWQIIPLQLLHSLSFGAFFTASVAYISRLVAPEMKSSAQSMFAGIAYGMGSLIGGALGGALVHALGYAGLYYTFAGVAVLGVIVLLFVPKAPQAAVASSQ
ncbi:MAG: MFS transporter [Planctomycetaceae bacterium]|nr:MFS transporter [Planctomycetaceae bacterium]